MTKQELNEYREILKEIEELESLRAESSSQDTVSGSALSYPFIKRSFTVRGVIPTEKNDELLKKISNLKRKKKRIEKFVENIPDRFTRRIFILKYLDEEKKTWEEIAVKIKGGNSGDGMRMMVNRYLKKYNKTSGKAKK